MDLGGFPFQTIDWSAVVETTHPGAPGVATWKTIVVGGARVRMVRYSAGYVADHWCARGHVVHVLEGELETELRDGRRASLKAGETYVVATGPDTNAPEAHRSSTSTGALLFIVD